MAHNIFKRGFGHFLFLLIVIAATAAHGQLKASTPSDVVCRTALLESHQALIELNSAITRGDEGCVIRLLDLKVPVDEPLPDMETTRPITVAADLGRLSIVRQLLRRNVSPEGEGARSALMYASAKGFEDIVRVLIDAGVDVNSRTDPVPPLFAAASFGRTTVVSLLLKKRAKTNLQIQNGATILMCSADNREIVELLLRNGADPRQEDSNGKDAIYYAVSSAQSNKLDTMLTYDEMHRTSARRSEELCALASKASDAAKRDTLLNVLSRHRICSPGK